MDIVLGDKWKHRNRPAKQGRCGLEFTVVQCYLDAETLMCGTAISDMAFSKFCGRFWTTSGCHCETLAVTALVLRPMPCQRGEAQTMGVDSFVRPSERRCLFERVRARAMPGTSLDAVWARFTSLCADRLRVLRNLLRSTRAAGGARRGAVSKHRVHARAGSCPTRKYAATNLLGVGFRRSESDGFGAAVQGWGYLRFAARTHARTERGPRRDRRPVSCL